MKDPSNEVNSDIAVNISNAAKKAELINHGKINIPKGLVLPFYASRSTAGPGAGQRAMVFGFGGTRVKLSIVRDGSAEFTLVKKDIASSDNNTARKCKKGAPYLIKKGNIVFIDDVTIEPTLMHAPNQAFINMTSECIFDCSFCVTPVLDEKTSSPSPLSSPTPERWIDLILNHAENASLEAVAITSGVAKSPHDTVINIVKIIQSVRARLPKIPIGVEPYITDKTDVDLLHQAGATEIKINLETPNRDIFAKVCKGLDYEGIDKVLDHAVTVFGRNRVCSNLLVGLGETDSELLAKVEDLAMRGIVATLRGLRVNELNKEKLTRALGYTPEPVPAERLLRLAEKQKVILNNYGLSTAEFKTMCHRCKCCDIVPQQDV